MRRRLHTQQKNTKIPTPEPSTAPAQGMFQPRPFGKPSPTADAYQHPDLKTSLMQAERYGHHLSQMHDTDVSVPQVTQPKMAMGRSMQSEPAAQLSSQPMQPSSGGRLLPKNVQQKMETAFSTDFSDVRVHEGTQAEAIGADAYAQGSQIHFQSGKYDPTSQSGQQLLGHELTHVVQQRAGQVAVPQGKGAPINSDPKLEQEADNLGAKAAQGEQVQVAGAGSGLQRKATSQPGHNSAPAVQLMIKGGGSKRKRLPSSSSRSNSSGSAGRSNRPGPAGPTSSSASASQESRSPSRGRASSSASQESRSPSRGRASSSASQESRSPNPGSSPASQPSTQSAPARQESSTQNLSSPSRDQLTQQQFTKDFRPQSMNRADATITKDTGASARPDATQAEKQRTPDPIDQGISEKRQPIPELGFHTTKTSNLEKPDGTGILQKGLDPNKGGSGGAGTALGGLAGADFNKHSQGQVHYSEKLSTAGFYGADVIKNDKKDPDAPRTLLGVRNTNPGATESDPRSHPNHSSYRTQEPIRPKDIAPLDPEILKEAEKLNYRRL